MHETLEENYRRGGYTQHLEFGRRPALLVVDFVNAYVLAGSPLHGAGCVAALPGAAALLAAARAAGIPVLHTNVAYEPGGRDGGVFFRKVPALACFEAGRAPELARFAAGLEPRAGESVITKQYASAFFGTALASTLTALAVDTVLLAGVSTSGTKPCWQASTAVARTQPLVVREAVGDRAAGPHEAALFDLQAKYAEVIDLEAARAYLAALRAAPSPT